MKDEPTDQIAWTSGLIWSFAVRIVYEGTFLLSIVLFKTEVMLFTLRIIKSLPNILFDGATIKFVTELKYLVVMGHGTSILKT